MTQNLQPTSKETASPELSNETASEELESSETLPGRALQRVVGPKLSLAKPGDVLALQRTIGNRAVQRLLANRKHPSTEVQRSPVKNTIQRLMAVNGAQVTSLTSAWQNITSAAYNPQGGAWTTAHRDRLKLWIKREDVYGAAKWYMTAQSWTFGNWEEAAEALDAHVRTQAKRDQEKTLAKTASKNAAIRRDLASALRTVGNWITAAYQGLPVTAVSYSGVSRTYTDVWDYLEKFRGQYRNWYPNGKVKSRMLQSLRNHVSTNFVLLREIFYALSSVTQVGVDEGDADVPNVRPQGRHVQGSGLNGQVRVDKGTGMETRRDDFTPEAQHEWVQQARVLNMPLGAGASNTTDGILYMANLAGATTAEKTAIAWAAFVFWNKRYYKIQGYGHTFHEVMDVASQNHGVAYTPGTYTAFPT